MWSSRIYSTKIKEDPKFETVFTFPFVKQIALFNRLKVYHLIGSSVAIPSCGILEIFNVLAEQSFLSAVSIGRREVPTMLIKFYVYTRGSAGNFTRAVSG